MGLLTSSARIDIQPSGPDELRWPVLTRPRMAGFKVTTEGESSQSRRVGAPHEYRHHVERLPGCFLDNAVSTPLLSPRASAVRRPSGPNFSTSLGTGEGLKLQRANVFETISAVGRPRIVRKGRLAHGREIQRQFARRLP
jgi:hypothetical protein